MKFDLTIKDISLTEARNILDKIGGNDTAVNMTITPPVEDEDVPAVATDTLQVDSEGLPWDERIHSSSKKTTAKGTWTRRKNINDDVFNRVTAELRGGAVPPAPIMTASIPPAPMVAPPPSFLQRTPAQPPAFNPLGGNGKSITDLFNKIQQMFASGSADAVYLSSLTGRLSQRFNVHVTSVADLTGKQDMIDDAFALIAADGK